MARSAKRIIAGAAAAALSAGALVAVAVAGVPGGGHGGFGVTPLAAAAGSSGSGGSGGGGEETTANNLSVPTVFVPDTGPFAVTCGVDTPSELVHATGDPSTDYPVDPSSYYYVQGVNSWQAQCMTAAVGTVSATVAWGDNLTGSANLSAGKPIRVEVVLSDTAETTMGGFSVVKLDPSALDRESAYGTLATQESGAYVDNPMTPFSVTNVYDAGATLKIYDLATPQAPIVDAPASAEINATGAIVYGYNLNVPTDGYYVLDFTAPNVTLTGADAGTVSGGHLASLKITVGTPSTEPTTPTTTVPVPVTPPPTSVTPAPAPVTPPPPTATPPSTGTAPSTPPASGSSGSTGNGGSSGSGGTTNPGASPGKAATAKALASLRKSHAKVNAAIRTTNRSIHKFHAAAVRAARAHLAIHEKLVASVKRLERRLHSLLRQRRNLAARIVQLQG